MASTSSTKEVLMGAIAQMVGTVGYDAVIDCKWPSLSKGIICLYTPC